MLFAIGHKVFIVKSNNISFKVLLLGLNVSIVNNVFEFSIANEGGLLMIGYYIVETQVGGRHPKVPEAGC